MKYHYSEKDLDLISWERIDGFINKIYGDITKYLQEKNMKIKYIVPIMRGGGIPAIILSHMFQVIEILPIQLKYNNQTLEIEKKLELNYLKDETLDKNDAILLVEGNHVTGKTAQIAMNMIKEKFGHDVNVIYVSLTRDYTFKNSVENVCYTTWAMSTNETKALSEDECKRLGINYQLVSVYPWENKEEELEALNADE